jgi:hypothetical protein
MLNRVRWAGGAGRGGAEWGGLERAGGTGGGGMEPLRPPRPHGPRPAPPSAAATQPTATAPPPTRAHPFRGCSSFSYVLLGRGGEEEEGGEGGEGREGGERGGRGAGGERERWNRAGGESGARERASRERERERGEGEGKGGRSRGQYVTVCGSSSFQLHLLRRTQQHLTVRKSWSTRQKRHGLGCLYGLPYTSPESLSNKDQAP